MTAFALAGARIFDGAEIRHGHAVIIADGRERRRKRTPSLSPLASSGRASGRGHSIKFWGRRRRR